MLAGIQYCINSLIAKTIYLYKFSVFSFYILEKTILGPEWEDDDEDEDEMNLYIGRTPLVYDIENLIIPKLE